MKEGSTAAEPPRPPLTNRGVLKPDDREEGGVDYLKLTVWAPIHHVCQILEAGVLDKYGWNADPFQTQSEWIEKPAGGRAEGILAAGYLNVIKYRPEVIRDAEFCSVEIKGTGCEYLGNEGIMQLYNELGRHFRIHASRIDLMAHTNHFTPAMIRDAVIAGHICSRSVKQGVPSFHQSDTGDTCTLGVVSKPNGGMKRVGDRLLRVYNRRGPTRIELQLTSEAARNACFFIFNDPIAKWPEIIRGFMRHYCDFVDAGSDSRPTRRTLLTWWNAFTQHAEKISIRNSKVEISATPIGKLDGHLQRHVRMLYAGLEAYGPQWLVERVEYWGRRRAGADHPQRVEELKRFRGSGIAGVPEDDHGVPF